MSAILIGVFSSNALAQAPATPPGMEQRRGMMEQRLEEKEQQMEEQIEKK